MESTVHSTASFLITTSHLQKFYSDRGNTIMKTKQSMPRQPIAVFGDQHVILWIALQNRKMVCLR